MLVRVAIFLGLAACGRIGFGAHDDVVDVDAASGDGGGDAPRCGGASLLSDEFAGTFDGGLWDDSFLDPGMVRMQIGGNAVLILAPNAAGPAYGAYQTGRTHDLTNDQFVVEAVEIPDVNAPAAEMFTLVEGPNNDRFGFVISGGDLVVRAYDPDPRDLIVPVPFAFDDHGFMRIREAGGALFAETSGDGIAWAQLATLADIWDPKYTRLSLQAGTYAAEAVPGAARWAGVNVGAAPLAGYCPIDSLYDDHADGSLEPKWQLRYGVATCNEMFNALVLALPDTTQVGCSIASRELFDLTDRTVSVEVPQVISNDPAVLMFFGVVAGSGDHVKLVEATGQMFVEVYDASDVLVYTTATRLPYSPVAHRIWRIRHLATLSTFVFELGDGANNWIELDRYVGAFPTRAVYVGFDAGTDGTTNPGTAKFTNINE